MYVKNQNKKRLKKPIRPGDWLDLVGEVEGGEMTQDNSQVSDLHNCLGVYAFHRDRKQHLGYVNL